MPMLTVGMRVPRSPFLLLALEAREDFVRGATAAHESLVRPEITPVAVATAPGDTDAFEEAMDRFERGDPVEVEDDVGVRHELGTLIDDAIVRPDDPTAPQTLDGGSDAILGRATQRSVLFRKIDFRLDATATGGH